MRDHVVLPAARLVGACWVSGDAAPAARHYPYLLRGVVDAVRAGATAPQFTPTPIARAAIAQWVASHAGGRRLIVITLREAAYWPARNSRLDQWRRALEPLIRDDRYLPVIVRDTAKAFTPFGALTTFPAACFDLDIRAALYEAAHLNLAVNNGPCHLMYFNPACRYLVFKQLVADAPCTNAGWWRTRIGLDVGMQYPWADHTQRLVWRDDDAATIADETTAMLAQLDGSPDAPANA